MLTQHLRMLSWHHQDRSKTMTTAIKSYSSKSNALRALKTLHPELVGELTNQELTDRYLAKATDDSGHYAIVIPPEVRVVKRHIYKGVQFRRRSVEPEGITSAVHDMFDEYEAEHEAKADETGKDLPPLTRKQMIARAVRDGVAYYTARTQYQKWQAGR
jgi:hypothetical protein